MLAFPEVDPNRRIFMPVFALVEVILAMAVPFLMIAGYHAFLNSEAGTVVEEITAADPGYRTLVQHTQVVPLIERNGAGVVREISLVVVSQEAPATIRVPIELYEVDGAVANVSDQQLAADLSETLRLDLDDPVALSIGGSTAVVSQLVGEVEPATLELPTTELDDGGLVVNASLVEGIVASHVALPSHESRLNLAVVNQVAEVEFGSIVSQLGGEGFQVQEAGNAAVFSTDPTVLTVPAALTDSPEVERLANLLDADILVDDLAVDQTLVTVLVGTDSNLID